MSLSEREISEMVNAHYRVTMDEMRKRGADPHDALTYAQVFLTMIIMDMARDGKEMHTCVRFLSVFLKAFDMSVMINEEAKDSDKLANAPAASDLRN